MRLYAVASLMFSTALACAQQASPDINAKHPGNPPALGIHWAKGVGHAKPQKNVNMTWHNWANSSFVGDKITGLDSWYTGFGNSNYARTSDEYTGTNGQVGASVTFGGHFVDTTVASGGNNTATILAEVCKVIPSPVANGYYPVYVDVKRGHNGYCAYHSFSSCGSTPVQFAFFFNLDGDAGCDPQDTQTGHSQGLAALSNVSGHELSEARTDPRNGGWYDSSGQENGDKCAWTFNVPYVTLSNGSIWKIQGEWSNAAYTAGTGYPNGSGQKGCLDGH